MKAFIYAVLFSVLSSFGFSQVSMLTNLPPVIAPNSTLSIEVKITKGSVANFSKYQMDVPAGVSVTEGNSKTGNFTFDAGRAKIVWVSIPAEPEFIITFNIMTGSASGSGVFNQKFFYLENGAKQEVEAEPINVSFDAAGSTVAINLPETGGNTPDNTTNNTNTNTNTTSSPSVAVNTKITSNTASTPTAAPAKTVTAATKTVEPVVATPTVVSADTKTTAVAETPTVEPVVTKTTVATETPTVAVVKTKIVATETPRPVKTEPVTTVSNAENMVYKVQVGAYGAAPDKSRFKAIGKVSISQEGGFYKALVGNFSSKEEALQKRLELIGKGFEGFVVAYKNGVRVK